MTDVSVDPLDAARKYVVANSGSTQFALLVREGLKAGSTVCEYGCGMLDLARWLVPYLSPEGYVGIDPHDWLQAAVFEADPEFAAVFENHGGVLRAAEEFVCPVEWKFDYVFAHSVLSHVADHQLTQFFDRVPLGAGGRILASLRIGERDSRAAEWRYPDVTYFTRETVEARAKAAGLWTHWRPEYRDLMVREHPDEYHDWAVFSR